MALTVSPKGTSAEKIQKTYKQLSAAAKDLNAASDGLGDAILMLDDSLQRLNLGISAWVVVSGNDDEDGSWWSRDIGYARIGSRWGIALKQASGNYAQPDGDSVEKWLFNDAPRWMRVESIGKIPELLEALVKQAEDTTKKVKARVEETLAFVVAVNSGTEESKSTGQK